MNFERQLPIWFTLSIIILYGKFKIKTVQKIDDHGITFIEKDFMWNTTFSYNKLYRIFYTWSNYYISSNKIHKHVSRDFIHYANQ